MLCRKLRQYLESHHVPYSTIPHRLTYTAQEDAAASHVPGRELAKSVLVRSRDELVMVVLPASYRVDFGALRQTLGAEAELASEEELKRLFPDCEVGAMPVFGNLYGLEVLADKELTYDDEIVFNGGTHTELVRMRYADFEAEVHPRIGRFSAMD